MTLVTFASGKGSPGVTTLACLVGATWTPGRRVVIVECDPGGGDLAVRFNLSARIGWLTVAASARRDATATTIDSHLQRLPGGLEVLVGARRHDLWSGDELAHDAAMKALFRFSEEVDVIVDVGRLLPGFSDTEAWLRGSAVNCIVLRPDAASVIHVHERVEALRGTSIRQLGLVVVGRGRYSSKEIERFTGVPVLGEVPDDPVAAAVAAGERGTERRLSRSSLVVSARRLSATIVLSVADSQLHPDGSLSDQGKRLPDCDGTSLSHSLRPFTDHALQV